MIPLSLPRHSSFYRQHLLTPLLIALVLALISWTSILIGQRHCVAQGAIPLCRLWLAEMATLWVSLGFLGAGVLAWMMRRDGGSQTLFLMAALTLASGKLSTLDPSLGGTLFGLSLIWLAPILVDYHSRLLHQSLPCRLKGTRLLFYGGALLLSLPLLFGSYPTPERETLFFAMWRLSLRVNLGMSFVAVAILLWLDYPHLRSMEERQHVRVIAAGNLLAPLPLLLLSLLPDVLAAPVSLPYEWTFPALLLIPLAYSYTLFRHVVADHFALVQRTTTYYLLYVLLLGGYLVVAALLYNGLDLSKQEWFGVTALMVAVLLLLFAPLHSLLARLIAWVWYGREMGYRHIIGWLTVELSRTLDRERLCHLLLHDLSDAMVIPRGALYLQGAGGGLELVASRELPPVPRLPRTLPLTSPLLRVLQEQAHPLTSRHLLTLLAPHPMDTTLRHWLRDCQVAYWLPLMAGETLHGLLLLSCRTDESDFTDEDKTILETLARQAGIAAHNVHLMEEVQARRQELSRAHQRLLLEREEERRQLARDLHDEVIQQLVGLSYQVQLLDPVLATVQVAPPAPEMQRVRQEMAALHREMAQLVKLLRGLIGRVRPPELEAVGLAAALRDYVALLHARYQALPMPEILIDIDEAVAHLPDQVTTCLFRVSQEAIRNTLRHASAAHLSLICRHHEDRVELRIEDDGGGFVVPPHLSELTRDDHYGLMGIDEQVQLVGGQCAVQSELGAGTTIQIAIPLRPRAHQPVPGPLAPLELA